MTTTPLLATKASIVAIALVSLSLGATAQTAATPGPSPAPAPVMAKDMKAPASYHAVRASEIIGHKVMGTENKNVGDIRDLIVNVNTGEVRYALLEFDPGFFKAEKLFAVPLRELVLSADGKTLAYKNTSRAQIEKAGVDKAEWKKAIDNRNYLAGIDKSFGFQPPSGTARSFRASELIGKDVNSRAGKDIGDIKELVIDMRASKVDYAVLAFDPSWTTAEKMYAFPLSSFVMTAGKDDLVLAVDQSMIESMKDFDAKRWANLNDMNRDQFMNTVPAPK